MTSTRTHHSESRGRPRVSGTSAECQRLLIGCARLPLPRSPPDAMHDPQSLSRHRPLRPDGVGVAEAAPRGTAGPLAPGPTSSVRRWTGRPDPGRAALGFRRNAQGVDRAAARRHAGVRVERALRVEGVQLVTVERGSSAREAIERLEADPAVRYAEPNRLRRASATVPDDPGFGQLWGLHNTGQTVSGIAGLPDSDIDAPEAWDLSTGGGALVAVVDEGIAYDHPDLAPNMWRNPGEVAGNGVDDDGNGYVDDIHGIDTVDDDSDPRDSGGHGTHVAGHRRGRRQRHRHRRRELGCRGDGRPSARRRRRATRRSRRRSTTPGTWARASSTPRSAAPARRRRCNSPSPTTRDVVRRGGGTAATTASATTTTAREPTTRALTTTPT